MRDVHFGSIWAQFAKEEQARRGLSARAFARRCDLSDAATSEWQRTQTVSTKTVDHVLAALQIDYATAFEIFARIAREQQAKQGREPVKVDGGLASPALASRLAPRRNTPAR